ADVYAAGIRVTGIGMMINTLLIGLKLIGGIAGNSGAMIADAVHSISDFVTDAGVIVGLRFLSKPADTDHAYGHGRVDTAISLLIGLAIIITGIGILKNGAQLIMLSFDGVFPHKPGIIALVMGIISILSKEVLYHYTRAVAKKSGSRTLEANAWHHRSDALSSVGTVIGVGGAIILGDRWTILDPAAAVFVSILVIKVGFDIGWKAFKELSDESLSRHARQTVEKSIKCVKGVKGHHKIRTRSLGRYVTVDAHIQVNPEISVSEGHAIATKVENSIRKALRNAAFVTIHVEPKESESKENL
ncbi:cation diffusion facilitator family transporter, partial [Candidatus Latescibacterota bacterium]